MILASDRITPMAHIQERETRGQILKRSPFLDTFIKLGKPDEEPDTLGYMGIQRKLFMEKLAEEYRANGALLILRGPLTASIAGGMFKRGNTDHAFITSQMVEIGLLAGFEMQRFENLRATDNPDYEIQTDLAKAFIHFGTPWDCLDENFKENVFKLETKEEILFRALLTHGVQIWQVYSQRDLPPVMEDFLRGLPNL